MKFKGSILIETITAMILVLLVASLVFNFFIKINFGNKKDSKWEAFQAIQNAITRIKDEKIQTDCEWKVDDYIISCKIQPLREEFDVYCVIINCEDHDRIPIMIHRLIYQIDGNK